MHRKYIPVLEQNASKLTGISNGIEDGFTPEGLHRQQFIPHTYSAGDLSGKAQCHLHLQRLLGLPEDINIPIVLWSQRFAESKGASVFAAALPNQLIKRTDKPINIQIIVFGRGNADIENWMEGKAQRFPNNIRFIRYNRRNALYEPLFIAGSDLVVAPSLEEPYGFLPRKAARLGTLSWVSRVGGMADLVQDGVNGFVIPEAAEGKSVEYQMDEKFGEIYRIFKEDRPAWEAMQRRAMEAAAFSWDEPAEKYFGLYQELLTAHS
jgi:starch synthase